MKDYKNYGKPAPAKEISGWTMLILLIIETVFLMLASTVGY